MEMDIEDFVYWEISWGVYLLVMIFMVLGLVKFVFFLVYLAKLWIDWCNLKWNVVNKWILGLTRPQS